MVGLRERPGPSREAPHGRGRRPRRGRHLERLDGSDVPRGWDPRQALSTSAVYRPSARTSLAATFTYHTGWPFTGVVLVGGVPTLEPRNGERHPDDHRLDVSASHRFPLGRGSLRAYLEVMNLYDRRNVCCIDSVRVRRPAGAPAYVELRTETRIGRVPSFGLEWEF